MSTNYLTSTVFRYSCSEVDVFVKRSNEPIFGQKKALLYREFLGEEDYHPSKVVLVSFRLSQSNTSIMLDGDAILLFDKYKCLFNEKSLKRSETLKEDFRDNQKLETQINIRDNVAEALDSNKDSIDIEFSNFKPTWLGWLTGRTATKVKFGFVVMRYGGIPKPNTVTSNSIAAFSAMVVLYYMWSMAYGAIAKR